MYPVVGFGGVEITSNQLLWGLGLYFLLSAIAAAVVPAYFISRPRGDGSLETAGKVLELREKLRGTVLKFLGGAAVIATVITTVQSIRSTEDTFKKAKLDLFNASQTLLLDTATPAQKQVEALQVMAFVSRSDPSYHRTVFDALSDYILRRSKAACSRDGSLVENRQLQIAFRIFGERNPAHDLTNKRFNLEHSCLTAVDMRDEPGVVRGYQKIRLSNANMLRSDLTDVNFNGAEMWGVLASDYLNPEWEKEIGYKLHRGEKGDLRGKESYSNGHERRRFVAHFIRADLRGANLSDSSLTGADFSGARLRNTVFKNANISRANFNGAQELTAAQLLEACVGRVGMTDNEIEKEQPYLWNDLRDEIAKTGIPRCR